MINLSYFFKQKTQIILLFICISAPFLLKAQNKKDRDYLEDSLKTYGNKILNSANDSAKLAANAHFIDLLTNSLKLPESFNYQYDSLTMIARLTAPDESFRIFNWQLPLEDGSYRFYGIIQSYNPQLKKYQLFELTDNSESIKIPQEEKLDNKHWYGAHYYKIIQTNDKKDKYYTLLGWKGYSSTIQKKVIDVITFNRHYQPIFGSPIFKAGKKTAKRIIFEYSAQIPMSVKYNEDKKLIIYDHLGPKDESVKGQYQFYGPDFSYDALEFKNGKWIKIDDFKARNEEMPYTKKDAKKEIELLNEQLETGKITKDIYDKTLEVIKRKLEPTKRKPQPDLAPKK